MNSLIDDGPHVLRVGLRLPPSRWKPTTSGEGSGCDIGSNIISGFCSTL